MKTVFLGGCEQKTQESKKADIYSAFYEIKEKDDFFLKLKKIF